MAAAGGGGEAQRRVVLVDHQDSFVHTLANYLRQTGAHVTTLRFGFDETELSRLQPDLLFLSWTRPADRLQPIAHHRRGAAAQAARRRRLPRAAGDGRALWRPPRRAALPAARQA